MGWWVEEGGLVETLVEDSAEMGRQNGPVTCRVSRGAVRPQCGFASRRAFGLQRHALLYVYIWSVLNEWFFELFQSKLLYIEVSQ